MAKQSFRNQNGLRSSTRALKNGLSPRVTAQVAALNGATVYGAQKLRNSDGVFAEPVSAQPAVEDPNLAKQPPLNTEGKQEADTKKASGGVTPTAGTGPDDKNPAEGTPVVALANGKKPDFLKKDDDEDEDDKVKNATSVYPSVRGNYQSALAAMRVKLANSDELLNDIEDGDDDDANEEAGQDNQPAATIIYGDQDLGTPAAALVVTTQAPAVQ